MQANNEENNLDAFFEMIDSIEDDISEMLESENSELSGYECLIISFNCLTLFCRQTEIEFSQIEAHFSESEKTQSGKNSLGFENSLDLKNIMRLKHSMECWRESKILLLCLKNAVKRQRNYLMNGIAFL